MEDVGDKEEEITIEDEQEAANLKHVPEPGNPSPEEVESHRCDHFPFRSWCKFCVMGRGIGLQHRKLSHESAVPRVGIDYFFITPDEILKRQDLPSEYGDDDKIEQ